MPQAVSVVCPACEAVLKITKPSLIGKKVACPACNKPVRIQAPAEAAQKGPTTAKKVAEEPLIAARTSSADLDTVLLADDDPPTKSGAKPAAPSSSSVPIAKPRSSSVWKKMSDSETSEFEAMLVDTDDEIDESTTELPFTQSSQSSGSIRKRKRGGSDSNEMDEMLLDTNAEQDAFTSGTPVTRSKRKNGKPKSKPTVQSYTDEADHENDADGFDRSSETSALEDDGFGATAPVLPRLSANVRSHSGGSTWNPKQKLPLYIGAVAGCLLLMALLLYSISGTHAPPPLAESAPGSALAPADEKEESAETIKGDGGKATAPSTGASSIAGGGESGQDGGHKGADPSSESPGDADRSPVGPKAVAAAAGLGSTGGREDASSADGPILGRKLPPFSATAVDKTTYQSADGKQKVLVVAFMGVECPLANLYYPRLVEVAKKYKGKSVGFLAINSNAQDTLDGVLKQSRMNRATFPVLKDAGNSVAKLFSAERTPEVFVLDAERVVRYHGMIDDQYGIRQRRSQPTKDYVIDAVDSLLAARAVSDAGAGVPYWSDYAGGRERAHELLPRRVAGLAEPLSAVPSQGRDRAVRAQGLRRGSRLGSDNSRGRRRTANASVAGRSAHRKVFQRHQPERCRSLGHHQMGGRRLPGRRSGRKTPRKEIRRRLEHRQAGSRFHDGEALPRSGDRRG